MDPSISEEASQPKRVSVAKHIGCFSRLLSGWHYTSQTYKSRNSNSFETNEEMHRITFNSSPWRHVVSEEDCPEDREDEKRAFERSGKPYWLRAHWHFHDCLHHDPTYCDGEFQYLGPETLHLTLLRACRQIYTEANRVLWDTDIFSFDDPTTLKTFYANKVPNPETDIGKSPPTNGLEFRRVQGLEQRTKYAIGQIPPGITSLAVANRPFCGS